MEQLIAGRSGRAGYRLVDNTLGWLTFLIAAFVYCSTIEPTASFWDCPEFITTGYKLEIGHPPGAPFFMLTANLFSQFASDPTQVARMVNMMSALLSASCILFLFWSITHLTRRLLISDWGELTLPRLIAIEASGLVGALIYTFSDTFWFSAVEGEVYAYSSAFTAAVFWLILKWDDVADEPHSDRWLVLIMYLTGLSIGVHLLNLLCVPAIGLVYYYRRYPDANLKGSLIALGISLVILAAVLYGVVPGIITVGGWFELFFVNGLGMPFNTGEIIYIILLVATVIWAVYETQTQRHSQKVQNVAFLLSVGMLGIPFYGWGWSAFIIGIIVLAVLWFVLGLTTDKVPLITARMKNTMLLCMLMLMIGYSTYASAHLPIHRWTRTHLRTSSHWATTSGATSMAIAPCSTDKPTPRRWLLSRMVTTASQSCRRVSPSISVRRKLLPMRRIPTSLSAQRMSTNTPRTCCSHVCTMQAMLLPTSRGWVVSTAPKSLTTAVANP